MSADKRDPTQWPHRVELNFPDRYRYDLMLGWGIKQFGLPDGDSLNSRWTFTTAFDSQGAFMVVWFQNHDDALQATMTWS